MKRKQLEKMVLDKMSTDMIFRFEMDAEEQEQAIASVSTATDTELLQYLQD